MSFKQMIEGLKAVEVDQRKIDEYFVGKAEEEKRIKLESIKNTIPEIYQTARIKEIDSRVIDFFKSENIFCWITGITGTGKTYILYALKNSALLQDRPVLNIVKEYDLDYKKRYSGFLAIDDVGLTKNDNYKKLLIDVYMSIIDSHTERKQKMLFTSNLTLNEWLKSMHDVNDMTAIRIESRMSNNTSEIILNGEDRRRK